MSSMQRPADRKLAIAVYSVLITISALLIFIALFVVKHQTAEQNLLINFATELGGFVIIVIIVERFFLIDKTRKLSEQIDLLLAGVNEKFNPVFWERTANLRYDVRNFDILTELPSSTKISMVGVHQASLLGLLRNQVPSAVKNGLHVCVLVLDADSDLSKVISSQLENPDSFHANLKRSYSYIGQIEAAIEKQPGKVKGSFNVRFLNWLPSCSMLLIEKGKTQAQVKVAINPPAVNLSNIDTNRRLCIQYDSKSNPEELQFFRTNFDLLWTNAIVKRLVE